MAQMIPNFLDYKINSMAEKRIYDWFRDDPATRDWTVLYSLKEINHTTLIVGESDFIVLAPKQGIFVLEVKGGRVSRDENGIWHFINKFGQENTKSRGPFDQAQESMFSLKKYVEDQNPSLKGLLWGYGVMVPDMDNLYVPNEEFSPQMIFNKAYGDRVGLFISTLSKYNAGKIREIYHTNPDFPTIQQCKSIQNILRPNIDIVPSMSSLIGDVVHQQIRFTEEEYGALDAMEDNKRCLFVGGAGTGKTLLAKEVIRRTDKKNICFLCFNKNLAEWIKSDFEKEDIADKCSFIGDFHSLMLSNIKKAGLLNQVDWQDNNPFSESLNNAFLSSLDTCPLSFDFLVIDELQDLLDEKDNFLTDLDFILLQGLSRGSFAFFGDFDHQSIYHPHLSEDEAVERLQKYTFVPLYRLTKNCRNTPEICDTIKELTGVTYKKILLSPGHLKTKYYQFKDENDEKEKLDHLLNDLSSKQKVKPEQIVILSPNKRENSVISNYDTNSIKNFSIPKAKGITFSTIHSFKGLESPVIIITDVYSYNKNSIGENNNSLIYVATSRAIAQLYIFESSDAAMERIMKWTNR